MPNNQNGEKTIKVQDYGHEIKVGNKTLKVRKWKAKDRTKFKQMLNKEDVRIDNVITSTLVYSCMEDKNIPLTSQEIQYLFVQLRKISISDEFKFSFECSSCDEINNITLKLDDVCKPMYSEYSTITSKDTVIELQDIKNKKFYEENKDEFDDIREIAFRIKSINGNNTKTFSEVVEYLEELDILEFDILYEQFLKINFTIDNKHSCICKKCKTENLYEFDEIPNFFPSTWTS